MRPCGDFLLIVMLFLTIGCAGMTAREQRMPSGLTIGSTVGTGAAAIAGALLIAGAAVGAAV